CSRRRRHAADRRQGNHHGHRVRRADLRHVEQRLRAEQHVLFGAGDRQGCDHRRRRAAAAAVRRRPGQEGPCAVDRSADACGVDFMRRSRAETIASRASIRCWSCAPQAVHEKCRVGMASNLSAAGVGQLFQLLRDGVPRTRAELAKSSGLARSTVAARVDELMRMGLVAPVADAASTGGRPPSQFALNPAAKVVVAADIGASHTTVAVTDLAGTVLAERTARMAVSLGPEPVLTWMVDTANELVTQAGLARSQVAAVGVGVPGPVEYSTGRPAKPPIMPGWDGFDVPGWV